MQGKLYLVATPIGNLDDLSHRCAAILGYVDFIAAEDTRVTLKLLNHLGIKKPMVSYYEHNSRQSGQKITARILAGESCALVTDAGMPAISDPGEDLVVLCADAGIEVIPIPGPCAVVAALAVSGLPSGRFTFEGFLSTAKKRRFAHLEELKSEKRTMIFYEAPHKLRRTLGDMLNVWGNRRISISRELTKHFEETIRTTLSEAVTLYEDKTPKGEFVLVIEGTADQAKDEITMEQALELLEKYREDGLSLKESSAKVSNDTGISKNKIYSASLNS